MLREVLELEQHNFNEFCRDYPTIYENIDEACQKLVDVGFYLHDQFISDTQYPFIGSLLLGIHRSLAVSALRFATRDHDEALMLLRMACEQARDLAVLVRNPLLFFLWKRYRINRQSLDKEDWEKFRKEFKFDLSTEPGKRSKWVYDHTSEVGVHGAGILSGHYRKLPPSESNERLNVLLIGLISLPALSRACLQPFFMEHSAQIAAKFQVTIKDFLLDLDLRYSVVLVRLMLASKELDKALEKNPTK